MTGCETIKAEAELRHPISDCTACISPVPRHTECPEQLNGLPQGQYPPVRLSPSRMVLTISCSGLSLIFMFATSFLIVALSYRRTKHFSVTRSRYGKFLYKRERAVKRDLTYCFTALCLLVLLCFLTQPQKTGLCQLNIRGIQNHPEYLPILYPVQCRLPDSHFLRRIPNHTHHIHIS